MHTTEISSWSNGAYQRYFLNAVVAIKLKLSQIYLVKLLLPLHTAYHIHTWSYPYVLQMQIVAIIA